MTHSQADASASLPMTGATDASMPIANWAGFAAEVDALGARLTAALGPDDLAHLRKMEWWGRACTLLGYASAWIAFNPLSAALIALGNTTRWATVSHPILHRGYDAVPGVPARYRSGRYARGWRRYLDWLDWMHPEAWVHEHNHLHHYHTGQDEDPDLVERNTRFLHRLPRPLRVLAGVAAMATWKLIYYAPNTWWAYTQPRRGRGQNDVTTHAATSANAHEAQAWAIPGEKLWSPLSERGRGFWRRSVLPYALFRFGLLPALFLPLGKAAWLAALGNSLLAEWLANAHSFLIIVPNHTGADVPRFSNRCRGKAEFYRQQVLGTVNYPGGSDWKDFLLGYLNYQIEHHLWPDLPMLKYREAAPELKAICRRHGVPYVEESVFRRFGRTWAVMMGDAEPPRIDTSRPLAASR